MQLGPQQGICLWHTEIGLKLHLHTCMHYFLSVRWKAHLQSHQFVCFGVECWLRGICCICWCKTIITCKWLKMAENNFWKNAFKTYKKRSGAHPRSFRFTGVPCGSKRIPLQMLNMQTRMENESNRPMLEKKSTCLILHAFLNYVAGQSCWVLKWVCSKKNQQMKACGIASVLWKKRKKTQLPDSLREAHAVIWSRCQSKELQPNWYASYIDIPNTVGCKRPARSFAI